MSRSFKSRIPHRPGGTTMLGATDVALIRVSALVAASLLAAPEAFAPELESA